MKSKLAFYVLLVGLFFTACKKSESDTNSSPSNQLTAKVDGANFQATNSTAIVNQNAGSIFITAEDNGENSITISAPALVGTHGSTSSEKVSGSYFNSDGEVWLSTLGNGSATVTITKYEQGSKKVSGTFSFTAPASGASGASSSKVVTNGTFTDLNFIVNN